MDGGAWWAAVHGVTKSRTRLNDFTFTFHFHALEKEMATHSNVLAWRIPGTGEPCGLPSMGLHRVRHDWSNLAAACNLIIMPPFIFHPLFFYWWPDGNESACNVGYLGSISGSGRSAREGNGNPLQYSCLESSRDRGAWQTTVHRIVKSQTWLSD